MIGIYKITSPSGKIYIGQSRNIEKRFLAYSRKLGKGQIRLYNSFKKYKIKNHKFEIIEECRFDELNIRERYYQDLYNVIGDNGLNCILTNTNEKPIIISEETRKKLSIACKGKNLGKKRSEETKLKMSNSRKGFILSPRTEEHCLNISKSKLGEKNGMFGKKGINNHSSKKVINITTGEIYQSLTECCNLFNLNPKNMSRCLNGTRKNNTIYKYL